MSFFKFDFCDCYYIIAIMQRFQYFQRARVLAKQAIEFVNVDAPNHKQLLNDLKQAVLQNLDSKKSQDLIAYMDLQIQRNHTFRGSVQQSHRIETYTQIKALFEQDVEVFSVFYKVFNPPYFEFEF